MNINKPELTKSSPEVKQISNPIIESEAGTKKKEVAGQRLDQPNTNAMIIKTIQGLITVILNNISKLPNSKLRGQALENIDLFEKTTLYELQRSFE